MFAQRCGTLQANKLIIRLQPDEYVRLLVMATEPGLDREGIHLREVPLDLSLDVQFAGTRRRISYERLLLALNAGVPSWLVRREEVEGQGHKSERRGGGREGERQGRGQGAP